MEISADDVLNLPGDSMIPDVSSDPIGLINMKKIDSEHFDIPEQRMEDSQISSPKVTGKYPVKLNSNAFRQVLDAFEKKLTTRFFYPVANRELSYGDAIIYQADQYRKVIEEKVDIYQPVLLK